MEGGFRGGFAVAGRVGVAAFCISSSWSFLVPSIFVAFAAAGLGSCSLAMPCLCMLVCVGIQPLALLVPSGLWFVCLVAVVCSPLVFGSLLTVSSGCSSYHRFCPCGLLIKYSLIPAMLRSAVLAASCSLCVLWRCPYFLPLWWPIEGDKRVVLVAVNWSVGAFARRFACVSFVVYLRTSIPFGACGGGLGPLLDPCACRHTSCSSCALRFMVCAFDGGGALSGGVWFPPFVYVQVSLIPCFFQWGRPRA